MKHLLKIALVGTGMLFYFQSSFCQDVLKTNPNETQVLQDTAGVRMLLISLPPGGSLANHTHPAFELYVVQGGTVEHSEPNGIKTIFELPAGFTMKGPATGVHADKNVGTTTVKMLLVELPPANNAMSSSQK